VAADRRGLGARVRRAMASRLWGLGDGLDRRSRGRVRAAVVDVHPEATVGEDVRFVGGGAPITVCARAWVARGARILPGVEIGPGALVRPYSVVHHDVPAGAVVEGNPAAVVGRRPSDS
jgi:acetyltransferase-like isoleucine patch superfamily enzyme